ncbi:MAG: hypothetical protein DIZ77_16690 [endosymbiont of Seepiophila jonesi]|uniref:Uncharacterized protein n=1 Tax=endosymbiont of Lamellibrachia luymesi TaxID=2200907 RepID=A0A370E0D4_9GAMM|nr:MAG: hypothetical protein DIZ77_16690 [endosymbiont of Seepiophila jonesi]RDH91943.1 MAG: hypothetical protein DIZ79_04750 [endosymbiont of Lamellibrachia luymesi]
MSGENKKGGNTQIIVALIGLAGILGGGVIANWDKIFPPAQQSRTMVVEPIKPQVSQPKVDPQPVAQPARNDPVTYLAKTPRKPAPKLFHGSYTGIMTEGSESISIQFTLQLTGNRVTGSYSGGAENGKLQGTVNGNILPYNWQAGQYAGRGITVAEGDRIVGTWGCGDAISGAGETIAQKAVLR